MSAALHGLLYGLVVEAVGVGVLGGVWLVVPVVMRQNRRGPFPFFPLLGYQVGAVIGAAAVDGWWRIPVYVMAFLVLAAFWWWRKNRDKVKELVGDKSRRLRDALVRRVREVARPRPVPRPVPAPR